MANTLLVSDGLVVKTYDGFTSSELDSFTAPEGAPPYDFCVDADDNLCIENGSSYGVRKYAGISSSLADSWFLGTGDYGITTDDTNQFIFSSNGTVSLYDAFGGSYTDDFFVSGHQAAWCDGNLYIGTPSTATMYSGFSDTALDTATDSSGGDCWGVVWDGTYLLRSLRDTTNTFRRYTGFTSSLESALSLSLNAWGVEIDSYTQRITGEAPDPGGESTQAPITQKITSNITVSMV